MYMHTHAYITLYTHAGTMAAEGVFIPPRCVERVCELECGLQATP